MRTVRGWVRYAWSGVISAAAGQGAFSLKALPPPLKVLPALGSPLSVLLRPPFAVRPLSVCGGEDTVTTKLADDYASLSVWFVC